MSTLLKSAIYYATELNWPVFPCSHKTKAPLTPNGFKNATKNIDQVEQWWQSFPDAFIGVPTGSVIGYTVIDVDKKSNGIETLARLEDEHGEIEPTIQAETQSGGFHYYFSYIQGLKTRAGIFEGIDIRNDGGYVIVPPSNGYDWISDQSPTEIKAGILPEWIIEGCSKQQNQRNQTFSDSEIPNGMRDHTLTSIAGTYRAKNISFDNAFIMLQADNLRCNPPLPENNLKRILESVYKYPLTQRVPILGLEETLDVQDEDEIQFTPDEEDKVKDPESLRWDIVKMPKEYTGPPMLKPTLNNVINLLESRKELFDAYRYNEFIQDTEITKYKQWMKMGHLGKVIDDNDALILRDKFRQYNIQPSSQTTLDGIVTHALNRAYHPIKEYLTKLKWDGTERLHTWLLDYCNAEDSEYVRHVGAMTLVAACARVDKPGVKYDHMLLLEGRQAVGKSTVVKILGGQWNGEVNIVARDRDTVDKMRGKWIIEVPEMVCFKRQDIESVKAFISCSTDRTRLAYARRTQDFPRQSIFIGTFNPDNYPQGYLTDVENRRFFPVHVNDIKLNELQRDRDQLFAEAWHLYKKGFDLYITDEKILAQAAENQQERQIYDEVTQSVFKYLSGKAIRAVKHVDGIDIWERVFKKQLGDFDTLGQRRVGKIMKTLGWNRVRIMEDGERKYVYQNPNYITEEVENEKPEWDE